LIRMVKGPWILVEKNNLIAEVVELVDTLS